MILSRDPDTAVGIDVAYAPESVRVRQTDETTLLEGIPSLVVEVLSPHDRQQNVRDKINEYLHVEVPLTWIVDPDFRIVRVHRPGQPTEMFNETQSLDGGDVLPGLNISVHRLFSRLD